MTSLLNLHRLQPGRSQFSLQHALEQLKDDDNAELREQIRAAIAADHELGELNRQWQGTNPLAIHGPGARDLDAKVDSALGVLHDNLVGAVKLYDDDEPQGRLAKETLAQLFPKGLFAVTSQPFVMQEFEVRSLLTKTRDDPKIAHAVRVLGLHDVVAKLGRLNLRYREALEGREEHSLTFSELRKARRESQERLSRIVVQLANGLVTSQTEEAAARYSKALDGVFEQHERVKNLRRRRRRPTDVDPETGSELEEPPSIEEAEGNQPEASADDQAA